MIDPVLIELLTDPQGQEILWDYCLENNLCVPDQAFPLVGYIAKLDYWPAPFSPSLSGVYYNYLSMSGMYRYYVSNKILFQVRSKSGKANSRAGHGVSRSAPNPFYLLDR